MTHTIETPRERLDRLRAEVADRKQAASAELPVRPADTFHALKTGVTISVGNGFMSTAHITKAGENIIVTQNMIDASRDTFGNSWMSLLGDDAAQIERWGEVRFRLGRAPEGTPTWGAVGDSDWREQREDARKAAWAEADPERRAAALQTVHERFGPAPLTSTIISSTPDPSIAAAEAQQEALAKGGVRHVSHYVAQEPGVKR
ncbi:MULTISPECIES: hypothetical protein [unclassified Microbacterium]|uniref:hypothetical protein n=1 Tax=unclassified Microbacterium TaxID=2609290 RepID=UPI000EA84ED7|nr:MULTISPECIES: hypothetical protein [unclassified Microbacterium]MBT2485636.1 hypothetical protein [Microbacterium sp. ISL-108]RKN68414.1 hypothetical protein D7252_13020 [Microbacterium sp. CGR2]